MPDTITNVVQMALSSYSPALQLVSEYSGSVNTNQFFGPNTPIPAPRASSVLKTTRFSPQLISWFAGGVILFSLGLAVLLLSVFIYTDLVSSAGAVLATIGSIIVALTLLRGQDIAERTP